MIGYSPSEIEMRGMVLVLEFLRFNSLRAFIMVEFSPMETT